MRMVCRRVGFGLLWGVLGVGMLLCGAEVRASSSVGDIHRVATTAEAVARGTCVKADKTGFTVKIEQWIVPPAEGKPESIFIDRTKPQPEPSMLEASRNYILFLYKTRDGWDFGSEVLVDEKGVLHPQLLGLDEPVPAKAEELAARIVLVRSPAYVEKLIATVKSVDLEEPVRSLAADRLGMMAVRKAFDVLAGAAADDGHAAVAMHAIEALAKIDAVAAAPLWLTIIAKSDQAGAVRAAARGLTHSADEAHPKAAALKVLVPAAQRWKAEAGAEEAVGAIIEAIAMVRQPTPEIEELVIEQITAGVGEAKRQALRAAGNLQIERAKTLVDEEAKITESPYRAEAFSSQREYARAAATQAATQGKTRP